MTILFASNELDAFNVTTPADVKLDTGANRHDSNFAVNGCMAIENNAMVEVNFTGQTDLWVHFEWARGTAYFAQTSWFFEMWDSAGGTQFCALDPDGQEKVYFRQTNGTTGFYQMGAVGGWWNPVADQRYTFDIHLVIHATLGSVEFYIDGQLIRAAYNVDTVPNSTTQCDRIRFYPLDVGSATANAISYISEVIIATTSTIGMRVSTLSPSAAGTTSAWTGAYTTIDELVAVDDTDFLVDDVNNDVSTFAMTNLSATAAARTNVEALVEVFRGQNVASGVQNIQHAIRSGGTDYFSSSVSGLTTAFDGFYNVRALDPATAAAWTPTNVDAVELGVRAIT